MPKGPSWSARDLQVELLECFGPPRLSLGQPLGFQIDVLDRFRPPCCGSVRALGLQLGGLGAPWASKLGSLGGSGPPSRGPWEALGSQMNLQRRVLGLLSQLQNVFGCTFAMLRKAKKNPRKINVFAWFFRCSEAFRRHLDLQVELLDWL